MNGKEVSVCLFIFSTFGDCEVQVMVKIDKKETNDEDINRYMTGIDH